MTCYAVRPAAGVLAIPEQWESRLSSVLSYTHKITLHTPQTDEETGERRAIQLFDRPLYVKDQGHLVMAYGARSMV